LIGPLQGLSGVAKAKTKTPSVLKPLTHVVQAIEQHAKALGTSVAVEEGTWPMVAIGTLELHM